MAVRGGLDYALPQAAELKPPLDFFVDLKLYFLFRYARRLICLLDSESFL